jgi:hypothetical protein
LVAKGPSRWVIQTSLLDPVRCSTTVLRHYPSEELIAIQCSRSPSLLIFWSPHHAYKEGVIPRLDLRGKSGGEKRKKKHIDPMVQSRLYDSKIKQTISLKFKFI